MARGIISTILGGVAGGFEGLAADQKRKREEEERRLAFQAMQDQQSIANMFAAKAAGGSIGGAPRIAQEAPARTAPPTSSALDSALFAGEQTDRGEGLIERPDLGQFARPRTEFVVDPDYEEITIGGQTFSFMTREAEERRAAEAAQQSAEAAAALRQEQRAHEISMKEMDNEFRREGDSIRHGYNVALENLRHSHALNRISGTGEDRISYADMEKAVMNTVLRGREEYDPDTGQSYTVPYTTEEAREMLLMLEDALGFIGSGEPIPGDPGGPTRAGPTQESADIFRRQRQTSNLNTMMSAPRVSSNVAPRQQTRPAGAAPAGSYAGVPASFTNDMISQNFAFNNQSPGAAMERTAEARRAMINRLLRGGQIGEALSAGVGW